MTEGMCLKLRSRKSLLFVVAFVLGVAVQAQSNVHRTGAVEARPPVKRLAFEVVSIRRSKDGGMPSTKLLPNGYSVRNTDLWTLIMTAYFPEGTAYWSHDRLQGVPPWITEQYDVEARVAPADVAEWQKHTQWPNEMLAAMMQTMLAERCRLAVHSISVEAPVYALVIGKHGSTLRESKAGESPPSGAVPIAGGGFFVPSGGPLKFFKVPMSSLAEYLSRSSPRPIHDETGLSGTYDFVLPRREANGASASDPDPATPYMIEDLGLVLKPAKTSLYTVVMDHIERPSAN
jgi:uncharacterized protein (TIGR03435 family)